ncbi:regulatory protein [Desulfohalotomaculum tongense]|nr:regulatory protein RecX [Desulforadius tongensis]MBM7854476.1 regulatory protein [Desulforadius tongensis]
MRLLTFRRRSEKEIKDKLLQKGYRDDIIDKVLDFLKEYQLIDDYVFARQWVEHRLAARPMGVVGLKYELKKYGIDKQKAEAVLAEIDAEMELELAQKLIQKKINNSSKPLTKQRAAGLLQRRGFSYDTIFKVLSEWD